MRILATKFKRVMESRGVGDAVNAAIVKDYGDGWIEVDTLHAAYPRARVVHPAEPLPPRDSDTVGWLEKAKNFAVASAQHVAAGMPTCSDEEIIRRHDICMGCEFFKDNSCGKCGCPISRDKKFISKLAWADQSCPVGKWGPA